MFILMVSRFYYKNITDSPIDVLIFGANIYYVTRRIILIKNISNSYIAMICFVFDSRHVILQGVVSLY